MSFKLLKFCMYCFVAVLSLSAHAKKVVCDGGSAWQYVGAINTTVAFNAGVSTDSIDISDNSSDYLIAVFSSYQSEISQISTQVAFTLAETAKKANDYISDIDGVRLFAEIESCSCWVEANRTLMISSGSQWHANASMIAIEDENNSTSGFRIFGNGELKAYDSRDVADTLILVFRR